MIPDVNVSVKWQQSIWSETIYSHDDFMLASMHTLYERHIWKYLSNLYIIT